MPYVSSTASRVALNLAPLFCLSYSLMSQCPALSDHTTATEATVSVHGAEENPIEATAQPQGETPKRRRRAGSLMAVLQRRKRDHAYCAPLYADAMVLLQAMRAQPQSQSGNAAHVYS